MASALSMMKKLPRGAHGVAGNLAKTGVGYGTSYLLAKHCHGSEKAGKIPVAVAAAGKLIPALATLMYGDVDGIGGMALSAMDGAGQAGVNFLGVMHGLKSARKAKGVRPILVPATADVKALPAGSIQSAEWVGHEGVSDGIEVLGALGMAQQGKALTDAQMRELQNMR